MKDLIKREQNELARSAERENLGKQCKVKIQTMLGDIVVRLYDETPIHHDNFLKLAKEGYYDGTLFHRVIRKVLSVSGETFTSQVGSWIYTWSKDGKKISTRSANN